MKKKYFLLLWSFYAACATSFAQSKIPSKVIAAFNQKFPGATKVKWDKENAHEYEASFDWKGEKTSVNYNDTGNWLETESPITFTQLLEKVQAVFNNAHKGATVKMVAKIETSKGLIKF